MTFCDEILNDVRTMGMGLPRPRELHGSVYATPGEWNYAGSVETSPWPSYPWGGPSYQMGQFALSEDAKLLFFGMFFILALALIVRR